MIEVQVAGVTLENNLAGGNVDDAFRKSHGDAVMLAYIGDTKKVVQSKRSKGFRLKDIARFKN